MTLAVIFGGRSCEHNVSIVTGVQTLNSISYKYKVIPIYITEKGEWLSGFGMDKIENFANKKLIKKVTRAKKVGLRPCNQHLYDEKGRVLGFIDCAINCCHGAFGEDGCLQGFFEMCGVPYTCGSVLCSAVSMDKSIMKKLFAAENIPIIQWETLSILDSEESKAEKIKRLHFPIIVKPCNLGSSIGIAIAKNNLELAEALKVAFSFDNKVIIERAATSFKEFNCAVLLKPNGELLTGQIEQPLGWTDFLTYNDKYISKSPTLKRQLPAAVDIILKEEIERLARLAFLAVCARGVARVDFIYEKDKLFVNEINTIPGSLSSYLFSGLKIGFCDLIDCLVIDAVTDMQKKDRLCHCYNNYVPKGGKK